MAWLQHTATACFFLTGVALIVAAARLSYANIDPQRAKAAASSRTSSDASAASTTTPLNPSCADSTTTFIFFLHAEDACPGFRSRLSRLPV
uniref:Uncharacterized protein n=1 Tax=Leersia perrieri TaxID=77586 RepID=A0A0D9VMZ6_9ORYZ